jgi:membrane protease YdiL (CAAX protease family)
MDRTNLSPLLSPDNRMFAMARQGKRLPNLVLSTVVLIVILFAAFVLAFIAWRLLYGEPEDPDAFFEGNFGLVVPFALMVVFLWAWLAFYEKRSLRTIGFSGTGAAAKYALGFLIGLGMVALAVGLMALTGHVTVERGGSLPHGIGAAGAALLLLAGFVVQGASEEVLLRGWYLPATGARYRPWVGLVVSSIVFTLFHGSANPIVIVNLLLFSGFLALYCLREGSIWGICGWHAAWNWTQANVFGLSVSGGMPEGGALFDLQPAGSALLSGGAYGPEASLMATVPLLAGTLFIVLFPPKNKR